MAWRSTYAHVNCTKRARPMKPNCGQTNEIHKNYDKNNFVISILNSAYWIKTHVFY